MFSGIIKNIGTVVESYNESSNKVFWVQSELATDLHIDQSLSHNGTCLTIEEIKEDLYRVTAIQETLVKTNLANLEPGSLVNLEKSITLQTLLDGHIVQGHVDTTAICIGRIDNGGSHVFSFQYRPEFRDLVIEKGSIAVNGVSLTVFDSINDTFSVAIIPYTYSHTNFQVLQKGDIVNLEFDMIGKYIKKRMSLSR